MKVQEALQSAIDAMEYHTEQTRPIQKTIDTLAQCKSALSDIDKCEPVGWQFYQDGKWHNGMDTNNHKENTIDAGFPIRELYTSPISKEWVGLSDSDIKEFSSHLWVAGAINRNELAKAIEAKLKQLNTEKG